jgi:MinD-like ATPase involved in chromosome partitioning or flagellar assembly
MAAGAPDAEAAFARLARVAERFLRVRLEYQGYVPWDDAVPRAIRSQEPVVVGAPHAPASLADRRARSAARESPGDRADRRPPVLLPAALEEAAS